MKRSTLVALLIMGLNGLLPSLSTSACAASLCADISGEWQVEEHTTVTYNIGGQVSTSDMDGTGPVTIRQTGCDISFSSFAINPQDGSTIELGRTGTVTGNHVTYSGAPGVIIPGATCSQNQVTGTGDLIGNEIPVGHSGGLSCSVMGISITVTLRGTATFRRTVVPRPPIAVLASQPAKPSVKTKVVFDGLASSDADGFIATYHWDFGDGTQTSGPDAQTVVHTFAAAGTYRVTLVVRDNDGLTGSTSMILTVDSCCDRASERVWPRPPALQLHPGTTTCEWMVASDAGEHLSIWSVQDHFEVRYFPAGVAPDVYSDGLYIGECYFSDGVNFTLYWGPDQSPANGTPDCFTRVLRQNFDFGVDDDDDGRMDAFFFSYLVCENQLIISHPEFQYDAASGCGAPVAISFPVLGCHPGPVIPPVRICQSGGPATTRRPDLASLCHPLALADVPERPKPMNLADIRMFEISLPVCDLNWDGRCDEADFVAATQAIELCSTAPEYKPWFDVDHSGCVTTEDLRVVLSEDADGDALMDWQEYVAGTNPRTPQSTLRISRVTRDAAGSVVIEWNSIAGKTYNVYRSADASWGRFEAVATQLPATPPLNQYQDPREATSVALYYRIGMSSR